jgi:hypothetical protein
MSLGDRKSAHNRCKEWLKNMVCDIQNLLYEYFSADHYEMPYLLSIGQIIDTCGWKIPILLSFAHIFFFYKTHATKTGFHHNLSTRWFDVKLIRYQFWCNRCAFRLIKSRQWYSGRKSWNPKICENCKRVEKTKTVLQIFHYDIYIKPCHSTF